MGIIISLDTTTFADENFGKISYKNCFLEYIQGDGASYINTGFSGYRIVYNDVVGSVPGDAPSIEITFATDTKTEQVLFGLINSAAPSCRIYETGGNGHINVSGKGATGDYIVEDLTVRKVFKYGAVYSYIDGVQVADNSDMTNQYRLNAYDESILLFGGLMGNTLSYNNAKIYEFKAYVGETIVLHLMPYADENGIVCMKDILKDRLYYNQGTGSFIGGEKI